MPLVAPTSSSKYEPPSEGLHAALCSIIADVGPQSTNYGVKPQVYFRWALLDETATSGDGEIVLKVVGRFYTLSMHAQAALHGLIEDWLGRRLGTDEARNFNLFDLLGKDCWIRIKHLPREDGGVSAVVDDIEPWPKDMKRPAGRQHIELLKYSKSEPDDFDKLPKFLQEKIMNPAKAVASAPAKAPATKTKTWADDYPELGDEPPPHEKMPDGNPGDDPDDEIPF
jgi:hypothetical protein